MDTVVRLSVKRGRVCWRRLAVDVAALAGIVAVLVAVVLALQG